MNENIKLLSEIEGYEIINVNDGEKYNYLSNNDIIIDDNGNLRFLIINLNKSKFTFLGGNEFLEIPWEYVKKIGARTIILDVEEENVKHARL
ncbi:MAG: YlmC/YmxH family sporulation protein [Clostridiaceae bacterium]